MSGATGLAVDVRDLSRVFRERRGTRALRVALDGVSLQIEPGETHGLLGPNGAGKSTLVKILATLLLPSSGGLALFGHDVVAEPVAVRRLMGLVLGGDGGLYNSLTARRNLLYWAALAELDTPTARRRTSELLERFGLADRADAPVETFSRGMRQRLHLARGLIADPPLLVLDEPTNGMDPVAALAFRDLVRELQAEGRTLLLATHDMAEAEDLCGRVTLIDRGRVLATETPRTLAAWLSRYEYVDVDGAPGPLLDEVASLAGVVGVEPLPDGGSRIKVGGDGVTRTVLATLVNAGVTGVRTSRMTLSDVYLHLVGRRGLEV